jgi:hypothetical protein
LKSQCHFFNEEVQKKVAVSREKKEKEENQTLDAPKTKATTTSQSVHHVAVPTVA